MEEEELIPDYVLPKRLPRTVAHRASESEQLWVRFGMASAGGLVLVIPMLIMANLESRTASLVITFIAMFLFAAGITFGTHLKPDQVLGATAAYAAVLVVFVDHILQSPHLITDMMRRIATHLLVLLLVRKQRLQMLCNCPNLSVSVLVLDEEPAFAMLNLLRKATGATRYDRDPFVQSLGDFHLETLAGGQLQRDVGAREKHVEHLVARTDAHNYDAVFQVIIVVIERSEDVFENDGAVWIVDRRMPAEQQLWGLIGRLSLAKRRVAPELCVGRQAVVETFRGTEAGDLNDVIAFGMFEEWAVLFAAHGVEIIEAALRALVRELLVQFVDPIGGSRHISHFL
ncbi:hypothetical protein MBLNU13_g10893t1 [Cladosporium sp. NU13]